MAEIKLELPDLASTAMGKAILAALGKEGEEKILQSCITYLTTPREGYGSSRISPLMDIVHQEAAKIARGVLQDRMANDRDFRTAVEELYVDAMAKFMGGERRQKLVDKMASRLEQAFSEDRY